MRPRRRLSMAPSEATRDATGRCRPGPLRTRTLRALGIETRVIEGGPEGSSEAVLLLHGNPGSAEDWAFSQPRLAEFARVVAFDLPGYGKAERPRDWDY